MNPQQPWESRSTTDATSQIPYADSIERHGSLSDRGPPVEPTSVAAAPGARLVHRLSVVRYLARITLDRSAMTGTSATGDDPTQVTGSVSSHANASNGIADRSSASTATRSSRSSA